MRGNLFCHPLWGCCFVLFCFFNMIIFQRILLLIVRIFIFQAGFFFLLFCRLDLTVGSSADATVVPTYLTPHAGANYAGVFLKDWRTASNTLHILKVGSHSSTVIFKFEIFC